MAIPAKQIGRPSSTKAALLWDISKQLETLTKVAGNVIVTPQITGGWSVVTGGVAGDGTVAQYSDTGFNITGPDDNQSDGWVYIKKYFPNGASLTVDYQWASADDGTNVDWPIYCLDETEPTGQPSDLTVRVGNTPESGTWDVTVGAGQWFSVGIYSDDSCCGRGFLSVDVIENVATPWQFIPGEVGIFPVDSTGYTLYTDGFTNNDDGQSNTAFPLAGDFYTNDGGGPIADNTAFMSTNGFMIASTTGFALNGNASDLYLTPGDPLDDGDTQNFWYQNYAGAGRWRTSMLVYCGRCCGSPNQQTPYSYILNIYRDGDYQYMEACAKTNVGGGVGPETGTETPSTATQVWQSDLFGNTWTYLGFGAIE